MQRFKSIGRALFLGIVGVASALSLWVSRSAIEHELEAADRWVYGHFAAQKITMFAAFLLAVCAFAVLLEAARDSTIRRGVAGFAVAGVIGSLGLILNPFVFRDVRIVGEGPLAKGHGGQKPELAVTGSQADDHEESPPAELASAEGESSAPVVDAASSSGCTCSPVKYEGQSPSNQYSAVDREYPEEEEPVETVESEGGYSEREVRRVESTTTSSSSSYSSSSSTSYSSSESSAAAEGQAAAAEARAAAATAAAEGQAAAAEARAAAAAARSEASAGY
jgi:hypothetical protein